MNNHHNFIKIDQFPNLTSDNVNIIDSDLSGLKITQKINSTQKLLPIHSSFLSLPPILPCELDQILTDNQALIKSIFHLVKINYTYSDVILDHFSQLNNNLSVLLSHYEFYTRVMTYHPIIVPTPSVQGLNEQAAIDAKQVNIGDKISPNVGKNKKPIVKSKLNQKQIKQSTNERKNCGETSRQLFLTKKPFRTLPPLDISPDSTTPTITTTSSLQNVGLKSILKNNIINPIPADEASKPKNLVNPKTSRKPRGLQVELLDAEKNPSFDDFPLHSGNTSSPSKTPKTVQFSPVVSLRRFTPIHSTDLRSLERPSLSQILAGPRTITKQLEPQSIQLDRSYKKGEEKNQGLKSTRSKLNNMDNDAFVKLYSKNKALNKKMIKEGKTLGKLLKIINIRGNTVQVNESINGAVTFTVLNKHDEKISGSVVNTESNNDTQNENTSTSTNTTSLSQTQPNHNLSIPHPQDVANPHTTHIVPESCPKLLQITLSPTITTLPLNPNSATTNRVDCKHQKNDMGVCLEPLCGYFNKNISNTKISPQSAPIFYAINLLSLYYIQRQFKRANDVYMMALTAAPGLVENVEKMHSQK
jgi:hypothetical protein